jgi:hypothetical protein
MSNTNDKRARPYVWVSWITSLLAGTDKCYWKSWTKANFKYAKLPGDGAFDLAEWTRQHDAMVQNRATQLRLQGWEVRIEEENAFRLDGERGQLAGKPDIIALRHDMRSALLIDAKSGRERPSDRWQVKVYIFAKKLLSLKGWTVNGEIEYRGRQESIPFSEVDGVAAAEIGRVMKIVTGEVAPPRVPSLSECNWCDIAHCPDRKKSDTEVTDAKAFF